MTASPSFKKVVVPCGPHDYDAFLDDNYIGSFHTPSQAQAELDRVAYEQARHTPGVLPGAREPLEADLAADPLAPFGVLGGPDPTLPVTDDALDRAFEIVTKLLRPVPSDHQSSRARAGGCQRPDTLHHPRGRQRDGSGQPALPGDRRRLHL
jgi:hypothetical protein